MAELDGLLSALEERASTARTIFMLLDSDADGLVHVEQVPPPPPAQRCFAEMRPCCGLPGRRVWAVWRPGAPPRVLPARPAARRPIAPPPAALSTSPTA